MLAEPFVHSAGFAGICAVGAALLALAGVALTVVQRRRADEREEWGRRFLASLTLLGEDVARKRLLGRTLVEQLLKSPLAGEDDRVTAERVIQAYAVDAGAPETADQLLSLLTQASSPGGRATLAQVEFVQADDAPSADATT